ncbi:MBL fold metallo-hydrolase [Ulvibacterium sp.]|uniref:MBL fold metallo-hydrolase n=1 Tax=Ulvibacterium sp. TaxID=2665914 RepID=UPI003BAA2CC5
MVKVSISEKRNPTLQQIDIGENTVLSTWGTIKVNKSHFFPSSFQLKTKNKVIYIDPVGIETTEKADYILITHSHPDHFSIKDIEKVIQSETKIICSKGVSKKLKEYNRHIRIMRPKDVLKFEDLDITATAAYNTKSVFLWIKAHPKSKENIGFVLTLGGGLRIYHAGDTDYIPEIKGLTDIGVALVPIGGDNLTMNEEEAARIVNQIKPQKVIPMHYEIKNREVLKRFQSLVDPDTTVMVLD